MSVNTKPVELDSNDLPAHCPNDAMPIWSSHPRVFLEFADNGEARCPYCSTTYRLKNGVSSHKH